ncbi:MAG: hypothetical protein KDK41_11590 [Leptospiraceae bacterium]|nr:hypothetical protein [Leptospiraceae bacterium]
MKISRNILIFALSTSLIIIGACKPSVKGQTSTFNRNIETLVSNAALYSGLAKELNSLASSYKDQWSAVESSGKNEEEKAEEMKKINNALEDDALFDNVQKYAGRKSGLESFLSKYAGKKITYLNKSTFDEINANIGRSRSALNNAHANLGATTANSKDEAVAAFKAAYEEVNTVHLSNMSVERKLKKEQKELKK